MRRNQLKWKPYKSGLEFAIAEDLKRKGIEFRYEPETIQYRKRVVKGVCDACGGDKTSQRRTYLPDFRIRTVSSRATVEAGTTDYIYIETKGRLTASDRAKMVAVKQDNPGLDIRFIFGANNKLNKNKNERYEDWAAKHGFPSSTGLSVPDDWVREVGGAVLRSEGQSNVGLEGTDETRVRRRRYYKRRKRLYSPS